MNLRDLANRFNRHCQAINRHQHAIRLIEQRMSDYADPRDLSACEELISAHYDRIADALERSVTARMVTGTTAEATRQLAAEHLTDSNIHDAHTEFQEENRAYFHGAGTRLDSRDMRADEWISGDSARWTPRPDDEREDTP